MLYFPYPEPVYIVCPSVHWNATGMPLVDPVYTMIPLGSLVNTCKVHWNATGKNLAETAPHHTRMSYFLNQTDKIMKAGLTVQPSDRLPIIYLSAFSNMLIVYHINDFVNRRYHILLVVALNDPAPEVHFQMKFPRKPNSNIHTENSAFLNWHRMRLHVKLSELSIYWIKFW